MCGSLCSAIATTIIFSGDLKRRSMSLNDRARALLADVGLETFADHKAIELSYGRRRALELATTLALDPELTAA